MNRYDVEQRDSKSVREMPTRNDKSRIFHGRVHSKTGMTLVEIMIAFAIFAVLGGGIVGFLTQSRKFAEVAVYHATAQTVAQSIVEQVQLMPYSVLSEDPVAPVVPTPIPLQFIAASSTNTALFQSFSLGWATDDITFTPIGEVSGGVTRGILLDMDYRDNLGNVVRRKKYMQMEVNARKQVNAANGNVVVTLTYRWEIPFRRTGGGLPVFETRQLRTVRSNTPSY